MYGECNGFWLICARASFDDSEFWIWIDVFPNRCERPFAMGLIVWLFFVAVRGFLQAVTLVVIQVFRIMGFGVLQLFWIYRVAILVFLRETMLQLRLFALLVIFADNQLLPRKLALVSQP